MKTNKVREQIKHIIVDKMLFATQFELAEALNVEPVVVRGHIHALRKQGYQIAKLARKHPITDKMLHAHYYTPYHSRDLDIEEHVKRGRPARIDAYANPVVRT